VGSENQPVHLVVQHYPAKAELFFSQNFKLQFAVNRCLTVKNLMGNPVSEFSPSGNCDFQYFKL
jgi:hypothetical protein